MFSDFLIDIMRAVGYGICHQMPERSLHYGGRALPVCARDAGLFLGFATCLAVLLFAYRKASPKFPTLPGLACVFLMALPAVLDGVTQYAGWRESSNAIRLVTGLLAGTAGAVIVFPFVAGALAMALRVEDLEEERMLEPWWSLPALLGIPAVISLAAWPGWPGAFWFWSLALMLAIAFTLVALNFTLVALVFEYVLSEERVPAAGMVAAIAIGGAIFELAASNRLHWLAAKFL